EATAIRAAIVIAIAHKRLKPVGVIAITGYVSDVAAIAAILPCVTGLSIAGGITELVGMIRRTRRRPLPLLIILSVTTVAIIIPVLRLRRRAQQHAQSKHQRSPVHHAPQRIESHLCPPSRLCRDHFSFAVLVHYNRRATGGRRRRPRIYRGFFKFF